MSEEKQKAEAIVELKCMVCGDKFMGEEPEFCCSGRECGCMGMPIHPIICDKKECNDKIFKSTNRN